jgi:hypothetical protein
LLSPTRAASSGAIELSASLGSVTAMGRVYVYADETGDLGYDDGSDYFGIGTATFSGDHRDSIWQGFELRTSLEARGVRLKQGLHAKNDSRATRSQMFDLIRDQPVRFDATFLAKTNAYPHVRLAGPVRLYKLAMYLHLKEIVRRVSQPGDEVFFIAGHLQTSAKRDAIFDAIADVCAQSASARSVVPCVWDAQSSWGIQVADYALWSVQRDLAGKPTSWHERCVKPNLETCFRPWG